MQLYYTTNFGKKQTILDVHLCQFHDINIQNSTELKRLKMADSMTQYTDLTMAFFTFKISHVFIVHI